MSRLAFDRATVRTFDNDGKLHIALTHISKSAVNPYYGEEIPDWQLLGLEPKKIYQLLRDPKELEKAAHTFNKLPILSKHVPVFVGQTDQEFKPFIIGFSGDDAVFNAPYLDNSLVVWDAVAIAAIEKSVQKEISCSYRYTPIMQSGVYEGVNYDGVMTDIIGNHVAIVESGRAGSDVVVGDSNPFLEIDMSKKSAKIASAVLEGIKGNLANDSKLTLADVQQLVKTAMDAEKMDDEPKEPVAKDADAQQDGESDEDYKKRMAEKEKANDEEKEDKEEKVSKTAMDAAIAQAVKANSETVKSQMQALRRAEDEVRPVVGSIVAQDSAESVYKFALNYMKADLTDVPEVAYGALFRNLAVNHGKAKKPSVAQDANIDSDAALKAAFPNIPTVRR